VFEAAMQAMTLELHPRRTGRDMNEHSGDECAIFLLFIMCVMCKRNFKTLASIGLTTFKVYTKVWVFVMC